MHKVLSEWVVGAYTVLELDQDLPVKAYEKYRIDGKDYKPIPVYDFPKHIAVESKGEFLGKYVEFA